MPKYGQPFRIVTKPRPNPDGPAPEKERRDTAAARFARGRKRLDDVLAERALADLLREPWEP